MTFLLSLKFFSQQLTRFTYFFYQLFARLFNNPPLLKNLNQQPLARANCFLFKYLPDELIAHILGEWVGDLKELIAFDISMCNREFRALRYSNCLQHLQTTEMSLNSINKLMKSIRWQQARRAAFCKQHITCYEDVVINDQISCNISGISKVSIDLVAPLSILSQSVLDEEFTKLLNILYYICFPENGLPKIMLSCHEIKSLKLQRHVMQNGAKFVTWLLLCCPRLEVLELTNCTRISSTDIVRLIRSHRHLKNLTFVLQWHFDNPPALNVDTILQRDLQEANHGQKLERLSITCKNGIDLMDILSYCTNVKELEVKLGYVMFSKGSRIFSTARAVKSAEFMEWFCEHYLPLGRTSLQDLCISAETIPLQVPNAVNTYCANTLKSFHLQSNPDNEKILLPQGQYMKYIESFLSLQSLSLEGCAGIVDETILHHTPLVHLTQLTVRNCKRLRFEAYQHLLHWYGGQLTTLQLSPAPSSVIAVWDELISLPMSQLQSLTFDFDETLNLTDLAFKMFCMSDVIPSLKQLTLGNMTANALQCAGMCGCFPNLCSMRFKSFRLQGHRLRNPQRGFAFHESKDYHLPSRNAIEAFVRSKVTLSSFKVRMSFDYE